MTNGRDRGEDGGDPDDPPAKEQATTDQIVVRARQLGWTVGITIANLVGAQGGAVI
jgi:hypothetical protein